MPITYTPLATTTLQSDSTSVTFSDISQLYTDLVFVALAGNTTATTAMTFEVNINGDGGNNYSTTYLLGGPNVGRGVGNNGMFIGTLSRDKKQIAVVNFQNYSSTTHYKSVISRTGTVGGAISEVGLIAGLWRNNDAITSLTFDRPPGESGTFIAGSKFSLYGIKAA